MKYYSEANRGLNVMKQVKLAYGKDDLIIQVPDQAVVIEPRHLAGLSDEKSAVLTALNPLVLCH